MRRFSRPLALALFALVIAVTPLSGFTSGGVYETWSSDGYGARVRVTLHDRTGLVSGIGPGSPQTLSDNPRVLSVNLTGGCGGYWINLYFRRQSEGYALEQRVDRTWCPFLMLTGYGTVAIVLRAPIDPATVDLPARAM